MLREADTEESGERNNAARQFNKAETVVSLGYGRNKRLAYKKIIKKMQVQEAGAKTVRRPAGSCIILFPLNKLPLANSYFLLKSVKMKLFVLNTKKIKSYNSSL